MNRCCIAFLLALTATTQIAGAEPDIPAKDTVNSETLAFQKKACELLDELLGFKDDPGLKEWGFSVGGPYGRWFADVKKFQEATPKGLNASIPIDIRTVSTDLMLIGMDYMKEGETQFIRDRLPEVKERIHYDEFKKHKNKPPLRYRVWKDSTGQFEVTAALLSRSEGFVTLKKKSGETIRVPMAKISKSDLEYLAREKAAERRLENRN